MTIFIKGTPIELDNEVVLHAKYPVSSKSTEQKNEQTRRNTESMLTLYRFDDPFMAKRKFSFRSMKRNKIKSKFSRVLPNTRNFLFPFMIKIVHFDINFIKILSFDWKSKLIVWSKSNFLFSIPEWFFMDTVTLENLFMFQFCFSFSPIGINLIPMTRFAYSCPRLFCLLAALTMTTNWQKKGKSVVSLFRRQTFSRCCFVFKKKKEAGMNENHSSD